MLDKLRTDSDFATTRARHWSTDMAETIAPLHLRADTDNWADLDPGEFAYRRDADGRVKWLHFWPVDSRCPLSAAVAPQRNDMGASWTLSGTEGAPTLTPSVDAKGIWHGFLTDGVARQ